MNLRRTHEYRNLIACKQLFLWEHVRPRVLLLGEIPQSRQRNKMQVIYTYIYILCTRAHKSLTKKIKLQVSLAFENMELFF
jgi:DNA-binding PucR family transcriptional regulator